MKDMDSKRGLIEKIDGLKKDPEVSHIVGGRLKDFEDVQNGDERKWFLELCFCLMTANSSAKKVLEISESLGDDAFLDSSVEDLSTSLKKSGYRFYNKRAQYIVEARRYLANLKSNVTSFDDEVEAREWLVSSVKGLGYKEASHFLRNVGYKNVAILDRHILNLLDEYDIILEVPTSLAKKNYHSIEEKITALAEKSGLSLAELDLFLWYMKTGKVLK